MNTSLFNIIFGYSLVLFTCSVVGQGLSFKTLNSCVKDYSQLLKEKDDLPSIEELPPGVYLARSVTQSLQKSDEKYFSYQTLLSDENKQSDLCFKGNPTSAVRSQSFIPTMIDRTISQKWGHTFWTISAILDKSTGAVNSKRSLIPNKNYREALKNQGFKVTSSQKTHDEFQIRLERDIASWKEVIVISYDQF